MYCIKVLGVFNYLVGFLHLHEEAAFFPLLHKFYSQSYFC